MARESLGGHACRSASRCSGPPTPRFNWPWLPPGGILNRRIGFGQRCCWPLNADLLGGRTVGNWDAVGAITELVVRLSPYTQEGVKFSLQRIFEPGGSRAAIDAVLEGRCGSVLAGAGVRASQASVLIH